METINITVVMMNGIIEDVRSTSPNVNVTILDIDTDKADAATREKVWDELGQNPDMKTCRYHITAPETLERG